MKKELAAWFGEQVDGWQHLRTDIIKHALPEQAPEEHSQNDTEADTQAPKGFLKIDDIMICGDHTTSASIEGAIISGNQTAAALLASIGS